MKFCIRLLFVGVIFVIGISSCECYQQLDPNKEITFFSRQWQGNDGWNTYFDDVLLDKDKAKKMSIKQYVTIAKNYIDTVKADKPVSVITFYGITSCRTPIDSTYDYKDEYAVVSIAFSNIVRSYDPKNITVRSITIWKDGEVWKDYDVEMKADKPIFDSLLISTLPLKQLIE